MQCSKVTNNDKHYVDVKLKDGVCVSIPPGVHIEDVDVANLQEIKDKVTIIQDLTEVQRESGKTKIFG